MGHKLTGVYIRPNGTEQKIRPVDREPGENTLAYYKFDNNLNDSSGNNHTLTASGTVTYDSGVNAVILSSGAYLYCDSFSDVFDHDWTVSVWINITTRSTDNSIYFSKGTGAILSQIMMNVSNTGYPGLGFYGDDHTGSIQTNTGTWYNIVCTYDYTTREYNNYVNAVNDITGTLSSQYTLSGSRFNIGAIANATYNNNYRVNGKLSEYIIEDKVRTAQEVANYYHGTKGNYGL